MLSDYMLKRRAIMMGQRPPDEKKEQKPIAKVSEKKKQEKAEMKGCVVSVKGKTFNVIRPKSKKRGRSDYKLKKIKAARIEDDNSCKIKSPVCTGFIECLNHKQKTSPANREDENNLQDSCFACNGFIEVNVEWAKANGHQVSRFKK